MPRQKRNIVCELPQTERFGITRAQVKSYEDMRICIKFMKSCTPLQRIDILGLLQEMIAQDYADTVSLNNSMYAISR